MKNVLIVSDCPTHKSSAGNRNCILQNTKLLQNSGYNVFFLLIDKGDISPIDYSDMSLFWGDKLFVFKQFKVQTILQKILFKLSLRFNCNIPILDLYSPFGIRPLLKRIQKQCNIDSVVVNYIWNSRLLNLFDVDSKSIYTHDVFSNRNFDGHSQWLSFSPNKEACALRRANHILAIQENESLFYKYLVPGLDVRTLYMPFQYCEIKSSDDNNILFFSGGNEHNINAIVDFIQNSWPKIVDKFQCLRLVIGGSICNKLKSLSLPPSIELKGLYDSPSDFYSLGSVVINPVYSGTGLKVKTFEAISFGKYVLANHHSLEGIYDIDNAPITECNSSEDYIEALDIFFDKYSSNTDYVKNCQKYIYDLNSYIVTNYKEIL